MANKRVDGTFLPASSALAYTVGLDSGTQVVRSMTMSFFNNDSVDRAIEVWFKPGDETLAAQHRVIDTAGLSNIKPKRTKKFTFFPNILEDETSGDRDEIHWAASAAGVVAGSIEIDEIAQDGDHANIKAQYLTTSYASIRQITAGKNAVSLFLGVCNHDSSPREFHVRAVAGTEGDEDLIWGAESPLTLPAGATWVDWRPLFFLGQSQHIKAKADVVSQVTIFGGVVEETL